MATLSNNRWNSPFSCLDQLVRVDRPSPSVDTSAETYVQLRMEYRNLLASVTPDLVLIGRVKNLLSLIEEQMRTDRRRRQLGFRALDITQH